MNLTPSEEKELLSLEAELGGKAVLSPAETQEMEQLESDLIDKNYFERTDEDLKGRALEASKISSDFDKMDAINPAKRADFMLRMGGKVGAGAISDIGGQLIASGFQGIKNIDDFLGGYGGEATESAIGAISGIDTPMGKLGDVTKSALSKTTGAYNEFSKSNPEMAQRIEGATNLMMLGVPFAKYGDDLIDNTYKASKNIIKKDVARMNSDEIAAVGGSLFEKADRMGGQVKADFWTDFLDDSNKALMKRSELGKGLEKASGVRETLDKVQQAMMDVQGNPQSLTAIKEADEILGKMAYEAIDNMGNMTMQGKQFKTMQQVLRKNIDNASPDKFIGGKEAFETVKEARRYWAASRRMQEVEKIIDSAKNRPQPTTILKNGFARLERNKKDFKLFTPEEQFAIKKAAKTGAIEGFLKMQGSGLVPIVASGAGMAATGGVGGAVLAAPAYVYQQGAKSLAEAAARGSSTKVLDAIQSGATGATPSVPSLYSGKALAAGGKAIAPASVATAPTKETPLQRAKRIYGRE